MLWRSTPDLTISARYTTAGGFTVPEITVTQLPGPPIVQTVTWEPAVEQFILTLGGATTAPIATTATAIEVEAALEALLNVTDATVTAAVGGGFDIVFVNTTAANVTLSATTIAPIPVAPAITSTDVLAQTITIDPAVTSFTLDIGGVVTAPITPPADAADLQAILDNLFAADLLEIPGSSIVVTGDVGGPYLVEFLNFGGIEPLIAVQTNPVVAPPVTVTVDQMAQTLTLDPLVETFELAFDVLTSGPIDAATADAAVLQPVFDALYADLIDPVVPGATVTVGGGIGGPFTIDFVGFAELEPVIATTLTPLAAAPPVVTVVTPPANPSFQVVTLEPGITTFTLSVDGVPTAGISGGADAAAIEAALEALDRGGRRHGDRQHRWPVRRRAERHHCARPDRRRHRDRPGCARRRHRHAGGGFLPR